MSYALWASLQLGQSQKKWPRSGWLVPGDGVGPRRESSGRGSEHSSAQSAGRPGGLGGVIGPGGGGPGGPVAGDQC